MKEYAKHPNSVQTIYSFPLEDRTNNGDGMMDYSMIPEAQLVFRMNRPVHSDDIDLLIEYLGMVRRELNRER